MKACIGFFIVVLIFGSGLEASAAGGGGGESNFPRSLASYGDEDIESIAEILSHRIEADPFNLVASLIFLAAIIHTFLSSKFLSIAHKWEHDHQAKKKAGLADPKSTHFGAGVFHFLGEVEAVFGIWALALAGAITAFYDWHTVVNYIGYKVNYTEPIFVVTIMILAATRPILKLSELMMWKVANLFGGMLTAWWVTILTVGPILGSFITEPAAMTISALLLAQKFYDLGPSNKFKYATIGLLFVNISVGGTFTHFAAPPVLMVATPWEWTLGFMFVTFGWKAALGILIANGIYYYLYRDELAQLQQQYALVRLKREIQSKYVKRDDLEEEFLQVEDAVNNELGFAQTYDDKCAQIKGQLKGRILERATKDNVDLGMLEEAFEQRFEEIKEHQLMKALPALLPPEKRPPFRDPNWDDREDWVPGWMMLAHVVFMAWTVVNAHYPALFIGGFLFFLGFAQVTYPYQNRLDLKPPLLVGFFLAGLVIHGGVQGWWIAPVLGSFGEIPLMVAATVLTAFNDNAAITYLSTLVPGFTDNLKYAVVAGAVTGGGLTVIANAPNPAGQSILKKYFEAGVSPVGLLKAALLPTLIMAVVFLLLRF